ncbi:MAG: polyprenyl synthetase family protein [Bacteroidaceae bacterium]|nr:polyprenyl synthetase family protein [Bacteroidaceae bacterium]
MRTPAETLKYFNEALAAMPFDRQPASLYEPVKYVLSMGGKRIRPVLLLMAYELYRNDTDRAMPTALGLETYHNYTLLHDDVMDRADVRRGRPTVHKVWNENAAILSGDSMLVMAYQLMAQADPTHLKAVLDVFTETALQIGEGQQMDLEFETRDDVREEEYIEMIRLKTSVLLACALKLGALQADASAADADHLYHFGEQLGLAFQLQDDLLDVYGDFETFGKKIGGDILCNKKTYMLINAFRLADEQQRSQLTDWISREHYDPEEKIQAVTALYNQIGVRALAESRINEYFEAALASLDQVSLPTERKQPLRDLALSLLGRNS